MDAEECLAAINGRFSEKFARFRALLLEYNEKFNLTSLTEEREVLYKHFVDSLAGAPLFPQGARVCEVGSGAGFPSVPLMIVREDLFFTLIESTGKKCEFLRVVARELHLPAEVLHLRAEEAGRGELRESFDICCARAVARLNTLAEYCLPLVRQGGGMIAYKGDTEEELEEGKRALSLLGGGEAERFSYSLPEGMGKRTILYIPKTGRTPVKYPRGQGKERSKPIV